MIPEIDVDALFARMGGDIQLIDVRENHEYVEAHVPGAQLFALSELADRVEDLPAGPLVIICKSGGRSMTACEFLAANGREATNVAGGTMGWIESGREVVIGSERG